MTAIICPSCNKSNPDTLEICQFCGTPLKNRGTEPLPTIRPGEMPVKQHTSDLESTLPSWLRDMRKGEGGEDVAPPASVSKAGNPPATPPPAKPGTPTPVEPPYFDTQNKGSDVPLDFLAGLSQLNDEEEAVPDWLASLKTELPSEPEPAAETQPQQPVDWLAGLQEDSQPQPGAFEQPAADWAFNDQADEPAAQTLEETPDWLTALKAQDTGVNVPAQSKPAEFFQEQPLPAAGDMPDWLADLGGEPAAPATFAPTPMVETPAPMDDLPSSGDLPSWLSDMVQGTTPLAKPATQPVPAAPSPEASQPAPVASQESSAGGDFPDWLSGLGNESAPAAQPSQPAPVASQESSAGGDFPDWLSGLGNESAPAAQPSQPAPVASQESSAGGDFPDWLSGLGNESAPAAQPSQPTPVASQESSAGGDFPDWLTGLAGETLPSSTVEAPSASPAAAFEIPQAESEALPDWLGAVVQEKTPEQPPAPPVKKAFSTGSLSDLGALDRPDELPDWMAGLGAATSSKTPEPAASPAPPSADTFDWLGGLDQSAAGPGVTEPKPTGQPESDLKKPQATPISSAAPTPEPAFPPAFQDSGNAQSLDSIFSMEMPDWLSGFTPSEPEPAKVVSEQPGLSTGNISPADLPSWVQAMRPIESVISGAQSGDEDQTVEKEGPLAGLRSVLPSLANAPGLRKPKTYSIKLQVDSTQMAQATRVI